MTIETLLQELTAAGVRLRKSGDRLAISGRKDALAAPVIDALGVHKAALLDLIGDDVGGWWPRTSITPEMLPLVALDQEEIDGIVAGVAGGASNVQDIYPLAPLQEGILFHHLMATTGDPYLLAVLLGFVSRDRLDEYVDALRAVIARHDLLRTSVAWEGLREPVQVVWRAARLELEEVELNPADGDVAEQLRLRFDPRRHRIDIRRAPLLRIYVARDAAQDRWVMLRLQHHLIADHVAGDVLHAEVQAHLLGRGDELPPPVPFRNYVAQSRLGASREAHEAYFRQLLRDVTEPTAPFNLIDVRGDGSRIDEARLEVEPELSTRLRKRARALGVSAASLCHVAFAQVLARVSGREDVVFGTVLFGRMQGAEGADRVMGVFINTLPVRVRVAEIGIETLVRQTHRQLAELMRHEHASLALAQRCSGVEAPAPLFSALLNYRHGIKRTGRPAEAWAGIQRISGEERTNYPLVLSVDDPGERLWIKAQVEAPVEAPRVCALMHGAVACLVEALESSPARTAGSIDVLPADERARVVEEWNRTVASYPDTSCVHELFEAQARRTPDAVAAVCGEEALTYGRLNARANQLARILVERGVRPDVRVGICVERSLELLVGELAVLKAGGAYVPLDPSYPGERLQYMLQDSGAAALLTWRSLTSFFEGIGLPVLALDTCGAEWAAQPEDDLERVCVVPDHLAYVIYTSGSTGRPKGVMVQHRNLANLIAWHCTEFGLTAGQRSSCLAGLGFDATVWEIWPALCVGASLALPRDARDPESLLAWWESQALDVSFLPTPIAEVALHRRTAHPCLKTLLTGGDRLRRAPADSLPFALVNNYGPTETTVVATSSALQRGGALHIGRPITNTRIYIVDAAGRPVPVGVIGELYIGGAGVARGYVGRPALTAQRFVPDPFSGEAGGRLYRTGDLARWLNDGTIEFVGRNDDQVKVRGFRIELGEIEARLTEHAGVREAVVVARDDTPGDTRLVAYWVGAEDLALDTLRAHLSTHLPEYMMPAAYVRLESLPLTPNGKVDRRALPAPEGGAHARRSYEAPLSEAERAVAEIWSEVLRVERVGRHDHFFELGGHSLSAVRVISRVRRVLGVEAAVADMFARPVLREFAHELATATRAELPPIAPVARSGRVALSFGQQRLWFLEQLGGMGSTYHVPGALRLKGALDEDALRRALAEIVTRHEVLRTTFMQVDGEPEQRIQPVAESGLELVEHDLSGSRDAQRELQRLMSEEAGARFDLERGPLIRGRLIHLAPDDHVLLLTMHHIVSDGWSIGVLYNEFSVLYGAYRRREPAPLPALEIQYADYAAWQRRWVTGAVLQAQADYWTQTLAGAPELVELPTDRPRPTEQAHAGATMAVELNETLTAGLNRLNKRHGTTLFMTVLAGWAAVLSRLSGQKDVVIGTPTANRGRREIEGLIGFFVNTLALRLDLSGSPSVAELLGRVKARALDAQHHQDIPFEHVVELVQPVRSLSHSPLFQVMFAWQNTPRASGRPLPGLELKSIGPSVSIGAAKFDLSLTLSERGGRIAGAVTYATALFDHETVVRYVGCLRRVLEEMVADDRQRVDRLPLLSVGERAQVVHGWNATRTAYPDRACVHQLVEAQAALTPDAVAVVCGDERLSYEHLNARANQLAHYLRQGGVAPDTCVGICVERSLEMVVGLLATLKAGGAYAPLDPFYPVERLRYMVADSAPAVLLTQQSFAGLFADLGVPVIDLGSSVAEWASQPHTNPARAGLTADHLVYVIYTSGSTGRPKGVMNVHRNVVNRIHALQTAWHLEPREAVLQNASLSFDVSAYELFWPLMVGARVVLTRPDGHKDPDYLVETIRCEQIGTASVVPSMLRVLLEQDHVETCTTLERVPCGGEALSAALVRRFYQRLPGATLYNRYGPSEAATAVIDSISPTEERAGVPIGRPVANARVYVLDEEGEPVPIGVVGEIYIGGTGVGRGYLGRADLTAERFLADAFSGEAGARVYRTGDVGRWRRDGRIEFLGRNDDQVKVRGFRVELGEIEARLAENDGIREAVVVARQDTPGDTRLVAYWTGEPGIDIEGLRAHLRGRLPEYMVPAAYVHLESLSLTPNGKLDRRALPAPEGDAFPRRGYEAPVGEVEGTLAEIWSEVLRVVCVGRHDHFFDLGGHSLLAVQVISRVRQALAIGVALRDVFVWPVLRDFARLLETSTRAELPAIEAVARIGRLALSFAQQRLWFLEQLEDLGSMYHIPRRLRLQGALDGAALRRALDRIVARHEALRTTFAQVDGEPEQRIRPGEDSGFALAELDLSSSRDADRELKRLMAEEARARFDLERGPLIRGRLIRMAPDDHVLLLTMHHIVSDAWSMGVLFRELGVLYDAFSRGESDPQPALAIQYADYAAWQRQWVDGEVLQAQAAYWKATLAGAPALLEIPTDHPRRPERSHSGARAEVRLDEGLTARLKALSRRHGTTLFMTLLAGWATVLSRLSGRPDVVIGTPVANRGRREVEGLIGFFVNTLAIRLDLSGAPSVTELLERTKARSLEAQHHQDIPFEQVVELVRPVRSLAHSPLFQVMFAWQNTPDGELALPGLKLAPTGGAPDVAAKFDLSLALSERGGRIGGGLIYATALFEAETVARYVGYFRRVLEEMVADEGQRVDCFSLLPADERARLDQWNATERAYPDTACVPELFEAQVERSPDAVAVVWGNLCLSYGELNGRANRLAHALIEQGVGPDTRVGICVERSPELVVGLLGVLKAGGAYVPLDPSYPVERLRYMLADSGAVALLTQRSMAGLVATGDAPVLEIEAEPSAWTQYPATNPRRAGLTPDHLAYVIYTSGSTGQPKGVMNQHRCLVNRLAWCQAVWGLETADAVLGKTSLSFDGSVRELLWPLVAGARVVLAGPEGDRDPAALLATIRRERISTVNLVPSLLQVLVEQPAVARCGGLQRVLCGGEALSSGLVRRFRERLPGVALHNLYGPSEAATATTAVDCGAGETSTLVPIGRPISNTRLYVLDAAGEPLPMGVGGELYIGGVGVARGYAGRPALTAERFVPDWLSGAVGGRLYRTGDLGRWRSGGTIEFLGRNDGQMKVRGFRIEPGEIEARLCEHGGVGEAVVVAREDTPGDQRLVAYWVGEDGVEPGTLRSHLAAVLPEHLVPTAYVRLAAVPRTPNGKVDRRALPAPEDDALVKRGYEPPADESEAALAEIWADVLGVERVGRHDHFFELGGHSLLAVKMISRVRHVLEVDIALVTVFERPVLSMFAEATLDAQLAQYDAEEIARLTARLRESAVD